MSIPSSTENVDLYDTEPALASRIKTEGVDSTTITNNDSDSDDV